MSFATVCPATMNSFTRTGTGVGTGTGAGAGQSSAMVPATFLSPAPASTPSANQLYVPNTAVLSKTLTSASPALYDPSALATPTYMVGTTTTPASLFSVLGLMTASPTTRYDYTAPGSGYWTNTNTVRLTTSQLSALYTTLTTTNDPPGATPATPPKTLITPDLALGTSLNTQNSGNAQAGKNAISENLLFSLQYEFCFWTQVYKVVLNDLIAVQAASAVSGNTAIEKTIVNLLNAINLRILDLTDIANHIATHVNSQISQNNADVAQMLAAIGSNTALLQTQGAELSSSDANAKLRSRMVDYTIEKNNYANQLLATYGFANLIALGLLFYIYRS